MDAEARGGWPGDDDHSPWRALLNRQANPWRAVLLALAIWFAWWFWPF